MNSKFEISKRVVEPAVATLATVILLERDEVIPSPIVVT